jgi:hypothetical protein
MENNEVFNTLTGKHQQLALRVRKLYLLFESERLSNRRPSIAKYRISTEEI